MQHLAIERRLEFHYKVLYTLQRVAFVAYMARLSSFLAVLVLSHNLLQFPSLIGISATQQTEDLTVRPHF